MDYPLTTWRLIRHPAARGIWNMAVDEAILTSVEIGESLPTLRLFAWEPACLSLGYAQPMEDVDEVRLAEHRWELVRRPTGGRAILHIDELTYSVIGPENDPRLTGGVLASYQRLSAALLNGLQKMGISAEAMEVPDLDRTLPSGTVQNPVCFEVPSNYEITFNGKKLIGSAQRRSMEAVLQHGSLPLCGDLSRIVEALHFADETARRAAADRLRSRATTVEQALGRQISWEQAADALTEAFSETLNLRLIPGEMNEVELHRLEELIEEKYSNPRWNERRGPRG